MQESPATSLVRIRTVDSRVVGAGFLSPRWVTTW